MKANATGLMVLASLVLAGAGCLVTIPDITIPESNETTTTTTTTTTIPPVVAIPSTGSLVDPGFSEAFMAKNPWEETGIATAKSLNVRACVLRAASGNRWWMISTPFVDHVRRDGNAIVFDSPIVYQGIEYRCRGWIKSREPKEGEANPPLDVAGPRAEGCKWSLWECRNVEVAK